VAAADKAPHEDGMDILKFFIAIMGLLAVLVAGMAVYNWTRVSDLESEVEDQQATLTLMRELAEKKELREMISKDRASKDLVDVLKKDLDEHLHQVATHMGLTLIEFKREGAAGLRQQGFDKISCRFTLDKVTLEVVTDYLFYLQASWPGLKIEEIVCQEGQHKKEEAFPGWKIQVMVSVYRPKNAT